MNWASICGFSTSVGCGKSENVLRIPNSKLELGIHEGRACTLALPFLPACLVQQEGRFSLSPATASSPHLQPMRGCPHFQLSFSSNELLFRTSLNFLLTSMKGLSHFVLRTWLWFAIVCLSWTAVFLLFLKNLFCWLNGLPFSFKKVDGSLTQCSLLELFETTPFFKYSH